MGDYSYIFDMRKRKRKEETEKIEEFETRKIYGSFSRAIRTLLFLNSSLPIGCFVAAVGNIGVGDSFYFSYEV